MIGSALPALDAHAHIAPDVTSKQIAALGQSVTFAMTRSLQEARQVKSRRDPALVWGIGVHPGVAAARDGWNAKQLTELLDSFALVGEIGLDRRGGDGSPVAHEPLVATTGQGSNTVALPPHK